MVSDPKAIHHILHIQGYNYPKTRLSKQFTALAFGRGVSWAAGMFSPMRVMERSCLKAVQATHTFGTASCSTLHSRLSPRGVSTPSSGVWLLWQVLLAALSRSTISHCVDSAVDPALD